MAFRDRRGSFRKCNLSPSQREEFKGPWLRLSREILALSATDPEKVSRFILNACRDLHPRKWKGAPLDLRTESLDGALAEIARHGLKGIPISVNKALVAWERGEAPLVLMHRKPTSEEVLDLQILGKRVVTWFLEDLDWIRLHDGRDAFSFLLHDLIHADHFFSKPEWRDGQIQFYRHCRKLLDDSDFKRNFLERDPVFAEQFEYAYSDMNSHPEHLFQYLGAIQAFSQSHGFR